MQNHFELFNLPLQFAVDAQALESAYRDVQNRVHPDKYVSATDAERVAMQWATRANEAYQTLKNPQQRAQYLCELAGVDLQTESNTAMPMAFLMQQMEWREELGDARAAKAWKRWKGWISNCGASARRSWPRSSSRSAAMIMCRQHRVCAR
jgi:molecular chaperone HscB